MTTKSAFQKKKNVSSSSACVKNILFDFIQQHPDQDTLKWLNHELPPHI